MESCLGPKSINKMVAAKYPPPMAPAKKKQKQITISSSLKWPDYDISKTEKNTSGMLPLIVYWQFDYKNTCTLNPQIPLNIFNTTVHSYAPHGLRQKLQGRRLETLWNKFPQPLLSTTKDTRSSLSFPGYLQCWQTACGLFCLYIRFYVAVIVLWEFCWSSQHKDIPAYH